MLIETYTSTLELHSSYQSINAFEDVIVDVIYFLLVPQLLIEEQTEPVSAEISHKATH